VLHGQGHQHAGDEHQVGLLQVLLANLVRRHDACGCTDQFWIFALYLIICFGILRPYLYLDFMSPRIVIHPGLSR
jgi:hypothetical protein